METEAILTAFFEGLDRSRQGALLLDYDGTLAPFRIARDEAVPYPGAREILREILASGATRLVIVSGRAVADLVPLLGLEPPPEIWGSHGWERLHAGGRYEPPDLLPPVSAGLTQAHDALIRLDLAARTERKPAGVAVHWRGLPSDERDRLEAQVRESWAGLISAAGLDLKPFDGGLELRVPGRTKAHAVRSVLAELPPEVAVAYLGDDLTDEDAFRALGDRGLSVLVRERPRETGARLRLEPPDGLMTFLKRWLQATGARAAPGGGPSAPAATAPGDDRPSARAVPASERASPPRHHSRHREEIR